MINQFILNVKRLIKWIPVIWNTYEDDWEDLIKVFDFQLLQMQEYHYEKGNYQIAGEIESFRADLKDVYTEEELNRWIKISTILWGQWKYVVKDGMIDVEFERPYTIREIKDIKSKMDNLRREFQEKQDKLEMNLWERFCKQMKGWWD